MISVLLCALFAAPFGEESSPLPPPVQVHPSGAHQTWCFVAQGPNEVQFAYHAGQDVWLSTWDADLTHETKYQRVNTLVQKQQDECEIDRCPVTGRYLVVWSDRYGNYATSMMSVGRIFDPDGTPRGDEQVLSDTKTSAWQPKGHPHPDGGWVVTHTRDWGEDSEVVRVSPDGEVTPMGLMHPQTGASENYPAIRVGPGGDYVGVYRLDNTSIMLRGVGMVGGVKIAEGWDPNISAHEVVYHDLTGKEVWRVSTDRAGHTFGTPEFVGLGRDAETAGRWTVWEDRSEGFIMGQKDGKDTQVLSQWLGVSGPGQLFRRKANPSTYRGRTIVAYTGWHTNNQQTAFFRVIEEPAPSPEAVEVTP